jgi:hypothetical protein
MENRPRPGFFGSVKNGEINDIVMTTDWILPRRLFWPCVKIQSIIETTPDAPASL